MAGAVPAELPSPQRPEADLGALVDLGRAAPQPEPRPGVPERPGRRPPPPDTPRPGNAVHEGMLLGALQAAGVQLTPRDTAAVTGLAALDTATVGTVVQWIRRGTPRPDAPSADT